MKIPEEFAAERIATSGVAGRAWIEELPSIVGRLAARWGVALTDRAPAHGASALVAFGVRRPGEPCALKVCWHEHDTSGEAAALRAWAGRGAVRLLDVSAVDNALLLEKLDQNRSLESVDLVTTARVIGGVIRQMAVRAPASITPTLTAAKSAASISDRQAPLGAVPLRWAALAAELAGELTADDGDALIHTDLHAGNVLAARRQEWLAIDPRPSIGHPEQSVPDLLLWGLPISGSPTEVTACLDAIVGAGDLDAERARAWTIIRAVEHWLWCQDEDAGLPAGAPRCEVCAPRCARILEALV